MDSSEKLRDCMILQDRYIQSFCSLQPLQGHQQASHLNLWVIPLSILRGRHRTKTKETAKSLLTSFAFPRKLLPGIARIQYPSQVLRCGMSCATKILAPNALLRFGREQRRELDPSGRPQRVSWLHIVRIKN